MDNIAAKQRKALFIWRKKKPKTYRPTAVAKSPRIVPGWALIGSVAPRIARPAVTTP